MSEKKKQQVESVPPYSDDDEFDFVDAYSDEPETADEELLPENTATSAIDCAFIGVGGGGGGQTAAMPSQMSHSTQRSSVLQWLALQKCAQIFGCAGVSADLLVASFDVLAAAAQTSQPAHRVS